MEFKTPKCLEKVPMVFGYPVITAMIVIVCLMFFLFTVFKLVLLSMVFLIIPLFYLYLIKKYPRRGECKEFFLDFKMGIQCIRFNEKLENLIVNSENPTEFRKETSLINKSDEKT